MVVADRRCQEVVLADGLAGGIGVFKLQRYLSAAEALFVWVSGKVCLADEAA
jgi:type IV secretory pathway TrbD component